MHPESQRVLRIQHLSADPASLKQAVEDLRHMLLSVIHDVAVLREVVQKNGLMNDELYKSLRSRSMVADYGGPGPHPWHGHSYYRHTLDEDAFLTDVLGFTEAERAAFREEAETRCTMT
ncbi:MAG: hypothetical protein KIS92_17175 [Planctomycetota bacterium]|nr:hypothetical protein [Planctomycetota bacterium]